MFDAVIDTPFGRFGIATRDSAVVASAYLTQYHALRDPVNSLPGGFGVYQKSVDAW